eukprot:GILJ01008430.1.p1 GENE.GILJ01008430.1~~GILJ01008430.1.p1  ORF type:complete len:1112 (-),score=116.85 GILJ01008430.1:69-3404(-)
MNQFEPLLEKLGRGQKRCPSCLGVAAARAFACPHCSVTFSSTLLRRRCRDEEQDESVARGTRKKQISFKKMFESSDSEDNETSELVDDASINEDRSMESSQINKRRLEQVERSQSHEPRKDEEEQLHMTPSRRGRRVILSDSEDSPSSFASDILSDDSAGLAEYTPRAGTRKSRKLSRISRRSQLGTVLSTQPAADESVAVSVIEQCTVDVSTPSVEAIDSMSLSTPDVAVPMLHPQTETAPVAVAERLTPGHKRCPQCQKVLAARCSKCSQCEHRFEPKAKVPRPKKESFPGTSLPLSIESSPQSDTRVRRARAKPPKRFTELLPDEERMLQQALRNSQTDVSRNVQKPLKDLLPSAPTYHPTEEEFADPFAYFRKIRGEAARFGICKIVPPNGWKPPLLINEQTFRFTVRSQIINELLQGKKFNFSKNYYSIPMFKEYADEFKAKWLAKMGVDINSVNDEAIETEYWRLVETNPEAVQVLYGADIDTVHTGSAFPRAKRNATDNDIQTPPPSTAAPFPWIQPLTPANGSPQVSTSSLPTWPASSASSSSVGIHTLPTALGGVAAANGHVTPALAPVSAARTADEDVFANLRVPSVLAFDSSSEQSGSSTTSSPERVLHAGQMSTPISSSSASAQPASQVPSATSDYKECSNRTDLSSDMSRYAHSPWNLNNMPFHKSSLLRFLGEEISGITAPWLYVGMLFSTFCWHNEDHYLYSINYMHKGASKTWYGVPGDEAATFERVLKGTVMELWNSRKELLSELVTMLSPALLHKNKVSVCRLVQNAGEFVLTFPQAYHAGFSHGFNIAEAVNIAPEDWIPYGRYAMDKYVASRGKGRIPVFPYEKLIFRACERSSQLDLSGQQSVIAELELMYKLEQEIYEALQKQSLMFSEPAAKLQSATDEASMRAADAALKEAYSVTGGVNWELSAVLMPTSQMNNVTMNMDMSQHMHLGVRLRMGMINLGGLTTLNGSEDDFKCESCQSLNFLSAVTCPLHKQTMCLSHANLLCTDQPKVEGKRCVSKKILYYRYSLDILLATINRAKSLWRWNKSLAANIRVGGGSGGSLESVTSNELTENLSSATTSGVAQQPIDTVAPLDLLASSGADNLANSPR